MWKILKVNLVTESAKTKQAHFTKYTTLKSSVNETNKSGKTPVINSTNK